MKKFLLTSALILALVLSLTAGTMAAYTQQVATFKSDVVTRRMLITADLDPKSFAEKFQIAPGDKIVRDIELTYQGEIPADTTLVAKLLKGDGKSIPEGVNLNVAQLSKVTDVTITADGDEHGATAKVNLNEDTKVVKYKVTVDWPYGTEINVKTIADTTYSFGLQVDVNAVSVNENRTNYAVPSNP